MTIVGRGSFNEDHPLYVYLPCGVGGGPGGVTFGLKQVFGDAVHCFFAEPTQSPCMLLGMAAEKHDTISVQEIGLSNKTVADGLAVGRASGFVGRVMDPMLDGIFTVDDQKLFDMLKLLVDTEGIWLEPSALAGMPGPGLVSSRFSQVEPAEDSTHIVWATGGSMVPEDQLKEYYLNGES